MKKQSIVISYVPLLSPQHEAGMLQLLNAFKNAGADVYFYYYHPFPTALDAFRITDFRYSKPLYWYYYLKALLWVDIDKWKARFKWFLDLKTPKEVDRTAKKQLKDGIKMLCHTKPQRFLCWNTNNCIHGIVADAARSMGIQAGGIEFGFFPETFIVDTRGTLWQSEIFNVAINYPNEQLVLTEGSKVYQRLKNQQLSLYAQQQKPLPHELTDIDTGKTKVLLLGIDDLDSAAYPAHYADRKGLLPFQESSFEQAKAIALADPSFLVVYKPHPSHNLHAADTRPFPNLWIINTNPEQLLDWCDVAVCSGSKMEISALMHHKPLVTMGAGLLYKKGCTYEVQAPGQVAEKIKAAKQQGFTAAQMDAFIKFLGYLEHFYLFSYANTPENYNETVLSRFFV